MDLATRRVTRSTVGKKAVMAVTGVAMVLFLLLHMLGNLKIFVGAEDFDHYAHWLRTIGMPVLPETWFLWIQRVGLLVAVIAHIWSATSLALRARAARPVKYAHRRPVKGSYAARTMRWGGVIIVLFVVYHILDLTTGHLNPVGDRAHPHANVVADFAPERWYVTLFYVLAVVALAFHLRHGVFSALRTLGQHTQSGERRARFFALAVAVVIAAGFLSVPIAVTTGVIQ
ncbi:succinate dehydrogenase cytochrome b subunit [Phytomonospora endophytica]|uniref:Succinate dehydrogenase / fumarate reductase cytochrome b subunit n=1 Tax=Phytomonospora endophytica TaxID=714109 RepID=A0A841FHD6_9ACTN|nr:succinate dehydrogenase cytochrome b subunit [Phytomonospora endophytica]MBB6036741.1 succinate dehydrogenase / fumarate reductase cytochrome b subunit [Phytomonospora endophytica]